MRFRFGLRKLRLLLTAAAAALIAGSALQSPSDNGLRPGFVRTQQLSHGRFQNLTVYLPPGSPAAVVLLLSGMSGWDAAAAAAARRLAQRGALVVGIDLPRLAANLAADGAECVFPDGDLENLSHFVQAYDRVPTYLPPLLAGLDSGASFAYAVLSQAPKNTFAGALTAGFCATLTMTKPLCKGSGFEFTRAAPGPRVHLLPSRSIGNPWIELPSAAAPPAAAPPAINPQCGDREVAEFAAQVPDARVLMLPGPADARLAGALARLEAQIPHPQGPSMPAALSDLPLIEIPAQPGPAPSNAFAIILSGDGGWAGLDKEVAAALSAQGIPVVGLDSLRYFWQARTPQGLAADTERIINYFLEHLGKQRVLLIGSSQGADVLPFAVNRLSKASAAHVQLAAILGMSEHALFEFHLSSWLSDSQSGPPTLPEVDRMTGMPVLCIYGAGENDSLCPKLDPRKIEVVKLPGDHHFNGDYAGLARVILAAAAR
jgi:type IV secretory pathway VirJ component